jgi:Mrp family chromosome partitioning ATPase
MQQLPVNGVVLVTSPQQLAGMVVRKASSMLKQLNVPVLAVVENMSYFTCPDCGKKHEIFGPSHSQEVVKATGAPLFLTLPIDPVLTSLSDAGQVEKFETDLLADVVSLL